MTRKVALVSCVRLKRGVPAPAQELYISDLFQKASAHARQAADEWYILSAKYGLVAPDRVISPYNVTLKLLPAAERRAWAVRATADLRRVLKTGDQVVFLAGEAYRAGLVDAIRDMGCTVEIPMEGLGIGQQLHWLKEQLR
jgi:Family of unknown function (DUF6884)